MKYDIGYFIQDERRAPFKTIIDEYGEHISSVYFPWLSVATDRACINKSGGYYSWGVQSRMVEDLKYAKARGIKLDLLFNANCYADKAVSREFANTICSIIDYLNMEAGGVDFVTTTSLFVAWTVKQNYPYIKTKASVNMRIGEIAGFEQVCDHFDSFILQRDYNRDFRRLDEMLAWGEAHGKQMRLLANSGCMYFCSGQVFHDNLCAHDDGLQSTVNVENFPVSLCEYFYRKEENKARILQNTWIRPEDVHHYESRFPSMKLATRTTLNPKLIIDSYVKQRYDGNLLELLEPNHALLFYPLTIENDRFPDDWFRRTTNCSRNCSECGYCEGVFRIVSRQHLAPI